MPSPEAVLTELSDSGELPGTYPASLDQLEPSFGSFLLLLRSSFITGLNQANANVTDGVSCPTFHFDFVDSPEPAFAFQHEGYGFIIVSIEMAKLLMQLANTLSLTQPILKLLDIDAAQPDMVDLLRLMLFFVELNFLVCHEFSHHVHGHLPAPFGRGLVIWKEFGSTMPGGPRLEEQAQEADADSYAVYIVLNNLIAEGGRQLAVPLFAANAKSEGELDEALLTLFIAAVGAVFYAIAPEAFDDTRVYARRHPPETLRMNYVMRSATAWCNPNRPLLEKWISLELYQEFMGMVAAALFGPAGRTNWFEQTGFLRSALGEEYVKQLEEVRLRQFAALRRNSEARKASNGEQSA
jgi:hypothetical protein